MLEETGELVHIVRYPDVRRLGALFQFVRGDAMTLERLYNTFVQLCHDNREDDLGWTRPAAMLIVDGERKLQAHHLFNELANAH